MDGGESEAMKLGCTKARKDDQKKLALKMRVLSVEAIWPSGFGDLGCCFTNFIQKRKKWQNENIIT
jgi:hypothetical protein